MPPLRFPTLRRLAFQGVSAYLESLVAQIRAPLLKKLDISLFNQVVFELPRLSDFTNATQGLKLPLQGLYLKHDADSLVMNRIQFYGFHMTAPPLPLVRPGLKRSTSRNRKKSCQGHVAGMDYLMIRSVGLDLVIDGVFRFQGFCLSHSFCLVVPSCLTCSWSSVARCSSILTLPLLPTCVSFSSVSFCWCSHCKCLQAPPAPPAVIVLWLFRIGMCYRAFPLRTLPLLFFLWRSCSSSHLLFRPSFSVSNRPDFRMEMRES